VSSSADAARVVFAGGHINVESRLQVVGDDVTAAPAADLGLAHRAPVLAQSASSARSASIAGE
jgi:hypothetical protein